MLFEKHQFCQGIVKIGDLLSNRGKFLQSSKVLASNLPATQYFKLVSVVHAIPIAWRLIIKQSKTNQNFCPSFVRVYKLSNYMKLISICPKYNVQCKIPVTKKQTLLSAQKKKKSNYRIPNLWLIEKNVYS